MFDSFLTAQIPTEVGSGDLQWPAVECGVDPLTGRGHHVEGHGAWWHFSSYTTMEWAYNGIQWNMFIKTGIHQKNRVQAARHGGRSIPEGRFKHD